jgi:hypothetical protein
MRRLPMPTSLMLNDAQRLQLRVDSTAKDERRDMLLRAPFRSKPVHCREMGAD